MSKNEHTYKTVKIQGKETEIYAEHPIRVSCMEHMDRELDDYVDKYEVAPDMFRREDVEENELTHKCMVCDAEGTIALLHVKGM
ncbi:CxxH/CxxC protein [Brevibacillus ginsengisoli]|uniref:CxxH/CxxC protein n=1 Tax=Brevibacillus ginsengisoli TaxID=363854 RepID=UPI003CEDE2AB